MNRLISAIFLFMFVVSNIAKAQHFRALHGSSFAGGLAVHQNPAGLINHPSKWDLTLFGFQGMVSNNIAVVKDYSILSKPSASVIYLKSGEMRRRLSLNSNINLFNGRIALDRKNSIGFGINLRNTTQANTTRLKYTSDIQTMDTFLVRNYTHPYQEVKALSNTWAELYGSYARTIRDNEQYRINIGGTLKISQGLSGAFAHIAPFDVALLPPLNNTITNGYIVKQAAFEYGYSANMVSNSQSTNPTKDYFANTRWGGGIDAGIEILIKTQAVTNIYDDDDYYDYRWKIGVSLLDIGFSSYKMGTESAQFKLKSTGADDIELNSTFSNGVDNTTTLNSTLSQLGTLTNMTGNFKLFHPARMLLNVDYFVQDHYFINAELTGNLNFLLGSKKYGTQDLSLFTITPRWEKEQLGLYMPVAFNQHGNLWIGGAFKAGPLLFGLHNLGYIFTKTNILNGGGYLGLTISSHTLTALKKEKRLDCPR